MCGGSFFAEVAIIISRTGGWGLTLHPLPGGRAVGSGKPRFSHRASRLEAALVRLGLALRRRRQPQGELSAQRP